MSEHSNLLGNLAEGWKSFIEFAKIQDTYHKTNILDYYPEFTEYWDA